CSVLFFFTTPPPPETSTLSLHDALPILVEGATAAVLVKQHFAGVAPRFVVNLAVALVSGAPAFSNVLSFVWANLAHGRARVRLIDRKSTRLNSSHSQISYAVFCLKKKKK